MSRDYAQELAACEIDRSDYVTLMECADWVLHNARYRNALGTHLDLSDEYLDELADKVRNYMNPEDEA